MRRAQAAESALSEAVELVGDAPEPGGVEFWPEYAAWRARRRTFLAEHPLPEKAAALTPYNPELDVPTYEVPIEDVHIVFLHLTQTGENMPTGTWDPNGPEPPFTIAGLGDDETLSALRKFVEHHNETRESLIELLNVVYSVRWADHPRGKTYVAEVAERARKTLGI
jgi:hypothetical protein